MRTAGIGASAAPARRLAPAARNPTNALMPNTAYQGAARHARLTEPSALRTTNVLAAPIATLESRRTSVLRGLLTMRYAAALRSAGRRRAAPAPLLLSVCTPEPTRRATQPASRSASEEPGAQALLSVISRSSWMRTALPRPSVGVGSTAWPRKSATNWLYSQPRYRQLASGFVRPGSG